MIENVSLPPAPSGSPVHYAIEIVDDDPHLLGEESPGNGNPRGVEDAVITVIWEKRILAKDSRVKGDEEIEGWVSLVNKARDHWMRENDP